jgi:hypothetical protein
LDGSLAAPKHGRRPCHGTCSEDARREGVEDADPAFAYIKSRLGVTREKTLQLGSPFQYEQQATLYIEEDLPEPNDTNRSCRRLREDR